MELPPSPSPERVVPREPLLFLALVRGAAGLLLAHLLVGVALSAWVLAQGDELPGGFVWAYLLGAGLAGGAVWGGAERLARGRGWAGRGGALAIGLLLAPLALTVGDWLSLLMQAQGNTVAALNELLASALPAADQALLSLAGAGLLLGPLFLARAGGVGRGQQLATALLGALLGIVAGGLAPLAWERAPLLGYAVMGLGVAVGSWAGLLAGAWLERRVARLLGVEAPEDPVLAATVPAGPAQPAAARAAAGEAEAAEAAGRWGSASQLWAEAFRLEPQARRAVHAARAAARDGDLEAARTWLLAAARWPGRAAREALADPALEALRGDARLEAAFAEGLAPGWRRAARTQVALLTLALVHTGFLALAIRFRGETAEVTRLRLEARLARDPQRLWELGCRLQGGQPAAPDASCAWIPRAVGPLPGAEESAEEAAAAAFRRAAEAGLVEAIVACAERAEGEGVGAERPAARAWWRQAAEAGDPTGMRRWAEILRDGWGGEPRDPAAAAAWAKRLGESQLVQEGAQEWDQ